MTTTRNQRTTATFIGAVFSLCVSSALAETTPSFDKIVASFESASKLDSELFAKGRDSNIRHLFQGAVDHLPAAVLREAGIEAYARAEHDARFYQLAALLLSNADGKTMMTWLNPPAGTTGEARLALRAAARETVNSTRAWKGYAAFRAADDLSHLTDDNGALGPSFAYHYIASSAGIQRSNLSLGYLTREYRLDNPDHPDMWGLLSSEETYFRDAAYCTAENLRDPLFPYDQALCDIATREANATDQESTALYAPGIDPDMARFFGLLGLVGLAIIENAKNNPNAGVSSGISPLQGPSALETHLWLNPGG